MGKKAITQSIKMFLVKVTLDRGVRDVQLLLPVVLLVAKQNDNSRGLGSA